MSAGSQVSMRNDIVDDIEKIEQRRIMVFAVAASVGFVLVSPVVP